MIGFNFNPVVKKQRNPKVKVKKESIIISKGNIGVIHITLEGHYYININNVHYDLTKDSFSCDKYAIVYHKLLINGTTIRQTRVLEPLMKNIDEFLPFRIGSICKGNLVKVQDRTEFDLKSIIRHDKEYIVESNLASNYFKDNYNIIKEYL